MSSAVITYTKREMKKVFPVFLLGAGYILFLFFLVYMSVRNYQLDGLLSVAYPENFEIIRAGDIFVYFIAENMNHFHPVAALFLEVLLAFRLFSFENRPEISDFIRILPIREWQKLWIKVGAGEMLILLLSVLFGIVGTCLNSVVNPGIKEINSLLYDRNVVQGMNSYALIWMTALLLFLSMSAIFLVLFVAQCCIHNMLIGFMIGFGVLLVPFYFMGVIEVVAKTIRNYTWIFTALLLPYPDVTRDVYEGQDVLASFQEWDSLSEKIAFLIIVNLAALCALLVVSRLHWHIRKSANRIINSMGVMEFILSGLALSVAVGIVLFMDNFNSDLFGFCIVSLLIAGGLLVVFNVIVYLIGKKRKGCEPR